MINDLDKIIIEEDVKKQKKDFDKFFKKYHKSKIFAEIARNVQHLIYSGFIGYTVSMIAKDLINKYIVSFMFPFIMNGVLQPIFHPWILYTITFGFISLTFLIITQCFLYFVNDSINQSKSSYLWKVFKKDFYKVANGESISSRNSVLDKVYGTSTASKSIKKITI